MVLNALYVAWDGEQNPFGIGCPTIFLRLGGCHLRCYKTTLGSLCDTPEALSRKGAEHTEVSIIFDKVKEMSEKSGIQKVTLTGGDPLWNPYEELKELFERLTEANFVVTVETSGTIDWTPYSHISENIFWVLDYKLKSAGVKNPEVLFFKDENLQSLRDKDYIKFVVYDDKDFDEMQMMVDYLKDQCEATLTVGAFWGGYIDTYSLFNRLNERKLLGKVTLNMQTHKAFFAPNYTVTFPTDI